MSSDQPLLPGLPAPEPRNDSLFLAIYPDPNTAARIQQLAEELRARHGLRGKPTAASRLHATLHFIGDYAGIPESAVRDVSAAATAAAAASPSFEVTFDRVRSFKNPSRNRPLVLTSNQGNEGLMHLHRCLAQELERARVSYQRMSSFTPHVTLLYDEHTLAEQDFAPVTWQVQEFVLVHSMVGHSKHIPRACWTLQGGC
jgi:2'-5' RNA ligase